MEEVKTTATAAENVAPENTNGVAVPTTFGEKAKAWAGRTFTKENAKKVASTGFKVLLGAALGYGAAKLAGRGDSRCDVDGAFDVECEPAAVETDNVDIDLF